MLIRTVYFEQASIIAAVACSLIVASLLKGTIGVGMPVVALPLLSLFIDVKSAAMLLSTQDARDRVGPSITPQALKTFARQARKRMRTESGGYRRDHLRALAQRVEVDAKEVRIMGSKAYSCARARRDSNSRPSD